MRDAAVGDVMDDHPSRFPVAIDDIDGLEVQRLGIERDTLGALGIEHRLALLEPELAVLGPLRSEEHTSELQSLMRSSYAVFCLKKKNNTATNATRRRRQMKTMRTCPSRYYAAKHTRE